MIKKVLLLAEDDDNDALLLEREQAVAHLLLDLKRPRMVGFEVLRWRLARSMLMLPAIVSSFSTTIERDIRQACELGDSSRAAKPVRAQALEHFVQALVAWWAGSNFSGPRIPM